MAKFLACSEVDPASGCKYTVRAETEEEILQKVAVHAKEHGIHEVTSDILNQVKSHIHDA